MRQLGAKVAFLTILALVLVLGSAYVGLLVYAGDRAPRDGAVEGVAVGGLAPGEAVHRLRARLDRRASTPLQVTYGDGRTVSVTPADAGLSVDWARSAAAAGAGRAFGLSRVWSSVLGGGNHRAVIVVDEARMRAMLDRLAAGVSDRPLEPAVAFVDGRAVVQPGRAGEAISRSRAETLLLRRYLRAGSEKLPVELVRPTVDTAEVRRFLADFARPAMSGPVTIVLAGHRITAPAKMLAPALSSRAEGGRLVPHVDADLLLDSLAPLLPGLGRESRDARVELRGGVPSIVPATAGVALDGDVVERRVLAALTRHGSARQVVVGATLTQPAFSTAQASALGVRRQVGRAVGHVSGSTAEVLRVARSVDGTVLRPHDRLMAPAGPAILRSVLARAARRAGLHELGAGFDNDSRYGVLVSVQVRGNTLTASMWSTPRQRA